MHQLDQVPGVVTGLYRELPAVLLDSFGLRRAGQVARARVS
jgi:hypothetical protein